jgi:hypothetical protein
MTPQMPISLVSSGLNFLAMTSASVRTYNIQRYLERIIRGSEDNTIAMIDRLIGGLSNNQSLLLELHAVLTAVPLYIPTLLIFRAWTFVDFTARSSIRTLSLSGAHTYDTRTQEEDSKNL